MKVPLLEYLDKLEADVRRTEQRSTMHQPHLSATLALIAKLREAVVLALDLRATIGMPPSAPFVRPAWSALLTNFDESMKALQEIEVPQ